MLRSSEPTPACGMHYTSYCAVLAGRGPGLVGGSRLSAPQRLCDGQRVHRAGRSVVLLDDRSDLCSRHAHQTSLPENPEQPRFTCGRSRHVAMSELVGTAPYAMPRHAICCTRDVIGRAAHCAGGPLHAAPHTISSTLSGACAPRCESTTSPFATRNKLCADHPEEECAESMCQPSSTWRGSAAQW